MLSDYGIKSDTITLFCNNTSAINVSKNPVQHYTQNHFIHELVKDQIVTLEYVPIENQKVDLFTKSLDLFCFDYLWNSVIVCAFT